MSDAAPETGGTDNDAAELCERCGQRPASETVVMRWTSPDDPFTENSKEFPVCASCKADLESDDHPALTQT